MFVEEDVAANSCRLFSSLVVDAVQWEHWQMWGLECEWHTSSKISQQIKAGSNLVHWQGGLWWGCPALSQDTFPTELHWWMEASVCVELSALMTCYKDNFSYSSHCLPHPSQPATNPYPNAYPWPGSQHVIWGRLSHTERLRRCRLGRWRGGGGGWGCVCAWRGLLGTVVL